LINNGKVTFREKIQKKDNQEEMCMKGKNGELLASYLSPPTRWDHDFPLILFKKI
jgi:hypothetical protein